MEQHGLKAPFIMDQLVADFTREHPNTAVTKAGKDHFKGAIQMGHSYIRVTKEFGEYGEVKNWITMGNNAAWPLNILKLKEVLKLK